MELLLQCGKNNNNCICSNWSGNADHGYDLKNGYDHKNHSYYAIIIMMVMIVVTGVIRTMLFVIINNRAQNNGNRRYGTNPDRDDNIYSTYVVKIYGKQQK